MDYYQKYLKYKNKYINLSNNCANNKLLKNGQIVLPSVLEQL